MTPEDFDLKVDVNGALRGDGAPLQSVAPEGKAAILPASESGAAKPRRRRAPGEAAGTRKADDTYDTPPELALACCEWLAGNVLMSEAGVARVLDPTAGGGPFVRGAKRAWPGSMIVAVDRRPECEGDCLAAGAVKFVCMDALALTPATLGACDLIVTNPPFKLADDLVRHFWASMKPGAALAFLLNITFLGSEDRWKRGDDPDVSTPDCRDTRGLFTFAPLAYVVPIIPRPSFLTIDGKATSPKFEAMLAVWVKRGDEAVEKTEIPKEPIRWEKPKKPRAPRKKKGEGTP